MEMCQFVNICKNCVKTPSSNTSNVIGLLWLPDMYMCCTVVSSPTPNTWQEYIPVHCILYDFDLN